jgi:hypothetical protein
VSRKQPSAEAFRRGLTGAKAASFDYGYKAGLTAPVLAEWHPPTKNPKPSNRREAWDLGYEAGRLARAPRYGLGYMQGRGAA